MLFKSFSFLNLLLPTKDTVIPNNLCFFPPYELLIDVKTKKKNFFQIVLKLQPYADKNFHI